MGRGKREEGKKEGRGKWELGAREMLIEIKIETKLDRSKAGKQRGDEIAQDERLRGQEGEGEGERQ